MPESLPESPPAASQPPLAPVADDGTFLVIPSRDEQPLATPEPSPRRLHKPTLIAAAAVGIAWVVVLLIIDQVIR